MTFQEYKEQNCPLNQARESFQIEVEMLLFMWQSENEIDLSNESVMVTGGKKASSKLTAVVTFESGGKMYGTTVKGYTRDEINNLTKRANESEELEFLCQDLANYTWKCFDASKELKASASS